MTMDMDFTVERHVTTKVRQRSLKDDGVTITTLKYPEGTEVFLVATVTIIGPMYFHYCYIHEDVANQIADSFDEKYDRPQKYFELVAANFVSDPERPIVSEREEIF